MTLHTTRELLAFDIGGHCLAVDANVVQEVVRMVAVAALPGAPAAVEGVINVRGTLVPVLDPRVKFGWPSTPHRLEQHLILVHAAGRLVALRVDRATDLRAVPAEAVVGASELAVGAEHTAGVLRLADGALVLHDVARFFSLEEAAQLQQALTAVSEGT